MFTLLMIVLLFLLRFFHATIRTLYGYRRRQRTIAERFSIVFRDDVTTATKRYYQVLRGETTSAFELRIHAKSGEILTGDFIAQPEIKQGMVVGVFGIARDVTDRVRAEKALRENEEHLKSLMESAANFAVYRLVFDQEAAY